MKRDVMLAVVLAAALMHPQEVASDERVDWRREESRSTGLSYRAAGALLGFSVGASVGMAVGYLTQTQEVDHLEYYTETDDWGTPQEVEVEYYSYEPANAHLVGAAIGGACGGVIGYLIGRAADGRYYREVPADVRAKATRSSGDPLAWACTLAAAQGMGVAMVTPPESSEERGGGEMVPVSLGFAAVDAVAFYAVKHRRDLAKEWRRLSASPAEPQTPESAAADQPAVRAIPWRPAAAEGRPLDWTGIPPLIEDPAGDASEPSAPDLTAVFLAADERSLCARMDFAGELSIAPVDYAITLKAHKDRLISLRTRPTAQGDWLATVDGRQGALAQGSVVARGSSLEMLFPRSALTREIAPGDTFVVKARVGAGSGGLVTLDDTIQVLARFDAPP